jgi:ubiquinone/menaquinone biosynthesis C-methylase UbiE
MSNGLLHFDASEARRLEATYLTPDVVAQRAVCLRMLDPREGERALDVGCGPGLLLADLGALVGSRGSALGIDISADMIALARRRCEPWPWITVAEGPATAIPAPDETIDIAASTQVLEYVPDVDAALAEIHRVLRPGGRVMLIDSDWEALVINADNASRQSAILDAWRAHAAHQSLPRSLVSHLKRAGFDILRQDVLMMFNTSLNPHSYAGGLVSIIAAFVVKGGAITATDAADWREDLKAVDARGEFMLALPRFAYLAVKR